MDNTPITELSSRLSGVLDHSQVIFLPFLVKLSLTLWAVSSPSSNRCQMLSTTDCASLGTIVSYECLPKTSFAEYPKIFSAAGFHETTLKSLSQTIQPTGILLNCNSN